MRRPRTRYPKRKRHTPELGDKSAMPFGKKSAPPDGLRFFNLDLHHAVIADVRNVFERLYGTKVSVTQWEINLAEGYPMGFPRATRNEKEVTLQDSVYGGPMLLNHVSRSADATTVRAFQLCLLCVFDLRRTTK